MFINHLFLNKIIMESKKCPYCDKVVEGFTEKHVNSLLRQHIMAKHPEKISDYLNKLEKNKK